MVKEILPIFAALAAHVIGFPRACASEAPLAAIHPPLLVASSDKKAAVIIGADDQVIWKADLPRECQDAWLVENGNFQHTAEQSKGEGVPVP